MADPIRDPESEFPTRDENFYRITSTTAGGAILGGVVGSSIAPAAMAVVTSGAIIGALVGLGISGVTAARAMKERQG